MAVLQDTEYTIIFKDNTKAYEKFNGEFITQDIDEADDIFEEYKEQVEQYYSKRWVLENYEDNWKEDYVEVFYSDINNKKESDL